MSDETTPNPSALAATPTVEEALPTLSASPYGSNKGGRAELRRLESEASPGKWLDYGDYIGTTECGPVIGREGGEFHNADQSDIDLIVGMRNSLLSLLDALDAKDRELAELKSELRRPR
jgi:hypothetical protein